MVSGRYKIRIIDEQYRKEFETGLDDIEKSLAETTRYINQKMGLNRNRGGRKP